MTLMLGRQDRPIPLFGSDALMVVACSQRKRLDAQLLPAIERYDGPTFRLVRRFLTQQGDASARIFILSAEFGLLACSHSIPSYDRRMTSERATELDPIVTTALRDTVLQGQYHHLLICAGRDYLPALAGSCAYMSSLGHVYLAEGSVGRRLSQLHDWLYGYSPQPPVTPATRSTGAVPSIRGVKVLLTADQLLDLARQRVERDKIAAQTLQSWYVAVDNRRVAPKWLVSQASGLPVSRFTSDDARRVLAHLGIPVSRI